MKKLILFILFFVFIGVQISNAPIQDTSSQKTIQVKKDTILKRSNEKRAMNISKLDTTSFEMELKANVEKINYQQKQLDSLLTRKKK